jgi:hypothetical protein
MKRSIKLGLVGRKLFSFIHPPSLSEKLGLEKFLGFQSFLTFPVCYDLEKFLGFQSFLKKVVRI